MPSTSDPRLGAFARAAIAELAPAGWSFVALTGGVVTITHPEFGTLDFDNDNYFSKHVTFDHKEGIYADAIISLATQNDDGTFELHLAESAGADADDIEVIPVYDRYAVAVLEGLEPDEPGGTKQAEEPAEAASEGTDDEAAPESGEE